MSKGAVRGGWRESQSAVACLLVAVLGFPCVSAEEQAGPAADGESTSAGVSEPEAPPDSAEPDSGDLVTDSERASAEASDPEASPDSAEPGSGESAADNENTPVEQEAPPSAAEASPEIETVPVTAPDDDELAAAQETESTRLDEVVVTAQRRVESVREVPLSMSVFDDEFLRDAGIADLRDLAKFIPNVSINPEFKTAKMRGVGTKAGALTEPAVALVYDGIYYGRDSYLFLGMLDTERVEVMRGPQGLIVGKNASAGALAFHSHEPEFEPMIAATSQLGSFNDRKLNIALGGPLLDDRIAYRVAAAAQKSDGAFYNTTRDEPAGGVDNLIARGSVLVPFASGSDLLVMVGHADNLKRLEGPQFSILTQQAREYHSSFDPEVEANADDRLSLDFPALRKHTGQWATARYERDFQDFTFTSIGGWADSHDAYSLDGDGGPGNALPLFGFENYRQFSEELRLVSTPGTLEYTAGLYGFHSAVAGFQRTIIGAYSEDGSFADQLPDGIGIADVSDSTSGVIIDGTFDQQTTTGAAFGQAKYRLSRALALTAGLRYTYERKSIQLIRENKPDGAEPTYAAALGAEEFTAQGSLRESDLSWSASAGYQLTHALNLYLTRSRGFRSGGYNSAALRPEQVEFRPETSDTWETGVKSRLWGGNLATNVGLFLTDFRDMQVLTRNSGTLSGFVASNAAASQTYGVEADARVAPIDRLELFATLAYLHAVYSAYPNGPCPQDAGRDAVCDLSGRPLSDAPEWKGSLTASYAVPLPWQRLEIGLRGDAIYSGFEYFTVDLDPLDTKDAHWEYNASVGIGPAYGNWSFDVQVLNLTDEIIRRSSNDVPLFNGSHAISIAPSRQVLGRLSLSF